MPDKDLAVGAIGVSQGVPSGAVYAGNLPVGTSISKKPCYLIVLDALTKTGKPTTKNFISLDKPNLHEGFIEVKGMFIDESEDEIVSNYNDITSSLAKESIREMMFPSSKIHYIRNLMFNANKPKSLISQERK